MVGTSLPFDFYVKDKESYESFVNYLSKMEQKNCYDYDSYNILMLHALKNFINLSRDNVGILYDIDLALGGHYHNGCIPNGISSIFSGNGGILSPQKNLFPNDVRGLVKVDNVSIYMGGYVNFRVENKNLNRIVGNPSVAFFHLYPSEKYVNNVTIKRVRHL